MTIQCNYYQRASIAVLQQQRCPFVCPSVCLSHSAIVSKRTKLASWFLHRRRARTFWFLQMSVHPEIRKGSPRARPLNSDLGWPWIDLERLLCAVTLHTFFFGAHH